MIDCTLSSFAYPIPTGKMGVSFLFKEKLLSLISWLSHCAFCLLCEYQYSHLDFVFSCRPMSRVFQIWNSLRFTCLLDRNYVALAIYSCHHRDPSASISILLELRVWTQHGVFKCFLLKLPMNNFSLLWGTK